MSFNFLNYGGRITFSNSCFYDSNIGYESNFDDNGSVDGWTYYDGVHTYGCWNGFLFGTLFRSYGVVGRGEVFLPFLDAEYFYTFRLIMKLNLKDRIGSQVAPSKGRMMWRTLSSTVWDETKSYDFDLVTDTEWNTYTINLSEVTAWQGDVNDLRIYPIYENGKAGDEFFIRKIEILSSSDFKCNNVSCDYYSNYDHNCPGIGERGYCKSYPLSAYVEGGTTFEFAETKTYTIEKDVNDTLLVNINEYGYENVVLDEISNCSGSTLATLLAAEISKLDVGGYSECDVEYTDQGEFIIYSGTYADDSTISIGNSQLARDLNFFNSSGANISTEYTGSYPASGFLPYSSFKVKTHQLYTLLDLNDTTGFSFDPQLYNVEGGRRDWLSTGLGPPGKEVRASESDDSGLMRRTLTSLDNEGKTIVDFNHPITASGRIKKVYASVTLDPIRSGDPVLSGAKVMFFRPLKNGDLRVLPIELSINDRDDASGNLYSILQEYVELDCDIFLNKGDLIGIYNANVYVGKSITGNEIDAAYYQVSGKPSGIIEVRQPSGEGSSGLMIYARSNQVQNRLVLNVDLGKRVNITDIEIVGEPKDGTLDFNIARCLDINWEVDLFGEDHTVGYTTSYSPIKKLFFNQPNLCYGTDCLDDGIKIVPDGIAADSFSVNGGTSYESYLNALHKKDGGSGVIPVNAKYFHCNGDNEWLGIHQLAGQAYFAEDDFNSDPIAFTMIFPQDTEKLVYKYKIYFKEQYNFRSFGLSTYKGAFHYDGTADDGRFDYIPNRDGYDTPWVRISLDGLDYEPDDSYRWADLDLYLAENPCMGDPDIRINTVVEHTYDETMAYYSDDGGLQYSAAGTLVNHDQYIQSVSVDWSVIEYEWEPIRTAGFRLYCNSHKSTKICEMELYCKVENNENSLTSALDILYSDYGDYWWPATGADETTSARAFIGDSPRYIDIVVKPINEIDLFEIKLNVSSEDVYMGDKGCQHSFFPVETKLGATDNIPQRVDFKNVYGQAYDLYVDIAKDEIKDNGTIFFSMMSDDDSITNPLVGPDAYYKKNYEYILRNYQSNVAINCPVYALKNLTAGAQAWYTYDKEHTWKYFGELAAGQDVDFSNLSDAVITTIKFPVLSRSQYWKMGFYDQRITTSVKEMKVFYQDEEITDVVFYHEKNQDVNYDPNDNTAPHLNNGIIDGSYYNLEAGSYIGFKLPSSQEIDKIVMYNTNLGEYENDYNIAGIDSSTGLCIHSTGDTYQTDTIVDVSYYEHPVTVAASGIYCDETTVTGISYDFVEDFYDCEPLIETFDGPDIDTSVWTDLVNASIVDGKLNITNSGIIGEVSTVAYFNDDFDANIELDIDNSYEGRGWGCYFQARAATGRFLRVGRTYYFEEPYDRLFGAEYGGSGLVNLEAVESSETSGLSFRLTRAGNVTSCYAKEEAGNWQFMGSSTVFGTDPVKLMLMSDLTPQASGITMAQFDNFSVDKTDSDWGQNTSYSSSFTCVSGLGPNGYAYQYDTIVANHADSAGYKIPQVFATQYYPFDELFAFTFDFSFQTDQFLTSPTGSSTDNGGVSVGILGEHIQGASGSYKWLAYFTGVQIVLTRDRIGIAIRNRETETASSFQSLDTSATTYFCRLTNDAAGHYHCYVWDDTWDGSSLLIDFGLDSALTWQAGKVGVGSGYSTGNSTYANYRATGWVSDFDFTSSKISENYILHGSSIKFSGNADDRLVVDYNNSSQCNIDKNCLNFLNKKATIDFFLKFRSLPTTEGSIIYLLKSWDAAVTPSNGASVPTTCSWAFTVEKEDDTYYWRFYLNISNICRRLLNIEFYPDLYRWYHFYLGRGTETYPQVIILLKNGYSLGYVSSPYGNDEVVTSKQDVIIGQNLDGWMDEIRVSSDYSNGGSRIANYGVAYVTFIKEVPTHQYERYYTYSLYSSSDNVFYGKNMDVDVVFDNSYSYHEPESVWCATYYAYFAVDLGQRYALDIIRAYPVDTSYNFDVDTNIFYSNKESSDPSIAFALTEEEQIIDTDFSGEEGSYPINWTNLDTINAESYITYGSFYQKAGPSGSQEYSRAQANFILSENLDFQIDYNLGSSLINSNSWEIKLEITDIDNSDNAIKFERCYKEGDHQYIMWKKDNATSWTKVFNYSRHPLTGTMRLVRSGQVFQCYVKDIDSPFESFELLGSCQLLNGYGFESQLDIYTLSNSEVYPKIEVWWDNFVLNYGNPIYSSKHDARWFRIKMLNGDGTDRTVNRLDVFSNISRQTNAVGQHNNYWDSLGSAVTNYTSAENIALAATVSGSSYVGYMEPDKAVDGLVYDGDLRECWGSSDEDNPWLAVYFSQLEPIFRVKLYHGYSTSDSSNIITDYKIQVSEDGETFSTIFTITDNDQFERTHDLATPVYARVVRLYVDAYDSVTRFVYYGVDEGNQFWDGAVLREMEVYRYYGFELLSSEDTPIIAIDLQQSYFIDDHELIGMNTEDTRQDWDNSSSNFAWSSSRLSDPKKIAFSDWGEEPYYARWVLIKRNTATHYPNVPTGNYPYTDTADYLKHVVIKASADESGTKPNPIEYPWMWESNISTLSYDYDVIGAGNLGSRSLRIEYPASSAPEYIRFIEGDHFGWDEVCSWRDGFGFNLYIDDIDNLDLSYGYFYFGGYDFTQLENSVTFRWNMTTVSGLLQSGWNVITLTFMYADDTLYTEPTDKTQKDPRRLYTIKWGKVGMVFRGKGNPLQLNMEGMYIARNYFSHYAYPGQRGLYLHDQEFLKANIGEIDLNSFTIEFWIRPDWNWDGKDTYKDFKFRTLFHIGNVNNDIFGAAVSTRGIEVYYGNLLQNFNIFVVTGMNSNVIDTLTHMAFVCSNSGKNINVDGSSIRVYINNALAGKASDPWEVTDNKFSDFRLGGQGILIQKNYFFDPSASSVDGVICRLKMYNVCKTDFKDSIEDSEYNYQSSVIKPSNFIEISKDNVTYYRIDSSELPFFFDDVPSGASISIWVRVITPKGLVGLEKRTAKILGSWDVGV